MLLSAFGGCSTDKLICRATRHFPLRPRVVRRMFDQNNGLFAGGSMNKFDVPPRGGGTNILVRQTTPNFTNPQMYVTWLRGAGVRVLSQPAAHSEQSFFSSGDQFETVQADTLRNPFRHIIFKDDIFFVAICSSENVFHTFCIESHVELYVALILSYFFLVNISPPIFPQNRIFVAYIACLFTPFIAYIE